MLSWLFLYLSHLCLIVYLPSCLFKSDLPSPYSPVCLVVFVSSCFYWSESLLSPCVLWVFQFSSGFWLWTEQRHPVLLYSCVLLHHSVNPPMQQLLTNPCLHMWQQRKTPKPANFPTNVHLDLKMCFCLVKPKLNHFIPSIIKSIFWLENSKSSKKHHSHT